MDDLKSQLAEVQSQLAFQEDTLTELNEALAMQQQDILQLRRQLELLKQRQDEQAAELATGSGVPPIEKPPHY